MKRIEGQVPDQSQVAQQALAWITFAKRQITTIELQNALAVEAGDLEFDTENLADLEDIISACQGLITLDEGSDIIRLVHYTAQEYLQRACDTWFPNAHDEIASTYLTYLSFDAFKAGPCSTDQEFETRLSQYPLYYYAAENWGLHIPMRSMHETTLLSFLTDIPKLDASVQGLWAHEEYMKHPGYSQRAAKEVTGSHLAAYFGLEGVILELLGRSNPIDSKDSLGRTPLSWAAQNAHESVVELLLRKGVNSNSRDNEGLSPISWAAISGQEAIIKLLLEKGVDPDAKHNDGRTPLSWAAYRGHHAVVKILLGNGTNPDSRDENDITPLSLAAFSGRKSVVKLLLEANVNPDSKNWLGRTALSQAAYSGHVAIVRMLLEKGADPRLEDLNG
jgi:ankyrin repeat protein